MNSGIYQTKEIFQDKKVNQICDLLFDKLVEQFPKDLSDPSNDYIYKGFILSGRAAAILQGTTATDLNNIVFQTHHVNIYKYLQTGLADIFKCPVIVFKERILFYYLGFYFEIWWSEPLLTEVLVDDIYVQLTANIPAATL
jgi:serine/threonine-protein kinase RIO1